MVILDKRIGRLTCVRGYYSAAPELIWANLRICGVLFAQFFAVCFCLVFCRSLFVFFFLLANVHVLAVFHFMVSPNLSCIKVQATRPIYRRWETSKQTRKNAYIVCLRTSWNYSNGTCRHCYIIVFCIWANSITHFQMVIGIQKRDSMS